MYITDMYIPRWNKVIFKKKKKKKIDTKSIKVGSLGPEIGHFYYFPAENDLDFDL